MRKLLAALLCLLAVSLASAATPSGLDGTRWKMRFRNAKAILPLWKGDVLDFAEGRFRDTECFSYGFSESEYTEIREDGRTVWTAVQVNPDGERAEWRGEADGDRMKGTLLWSRPDGRSRLYKFSARRKGSDGEEKEVALD